MSDRRSYTGTKRTSICMNCFNILSIASIQSIS
ncbi:CLUMA_CG004175, isoform A [Clunio marinus]|uniref:CLUMA_CG004175, isoform A n=1 Tax=Clunio marinus TaxID=568069 RepID=A0A1J1HVI3_9DIPT|nr:CLUMA_CG004175, isoform A [Clunio marinus]